MIGNIIAAIVIGIIAGYLGRALLPGPDPMGFVGTVIAGIVGALVGYFIFTGLLGIGDTDKFDLGGIVGAVIGTMLVLLAYRTFGPRRAPGQRLAPQQRPRQRLRRPRGEREHGHGARRHLREARVDDAGRARRRPGAERVEGRPPGASTRPGQPAATHAACSGAARTAPCAICARTFPELIVACGVTRYVSAGRSSAGSARAGAGLEVAAHRLQALEQRPALRAPPRRQRGHGDALRVAGQGVRLFREDPLPLRDRAGPQADLPRPRPPRGDRVGVRGVRREARQAGDGGRPRQLATPRQRGDGAAPEDEVHAQRVVRHAAPEAWSRPAPHRPRGRGRSGLQHLVGEAHGQGAVADRAGDALRRPGADVARREHAGPDGLEQVRLAGRGERQRFGPSAAAAPPPHRM